MKLKEALGALSPSCREAVRLQSEQMDHSLNLTQRLGLRLHLLLCKWCRRYGAQIRFLRSVGRQEPHAPAASIPASLSTEARERIRQRLDKERK